jgi:hypothetical protein
MNKKNGKRIFTPSDDALIREQPVTGIGLKTLETMLGTSRGALMRRADELGVSLDDHYEAVSTPGDPLHRWTRRPVIGTVEASARRPEVI